MENTKTFLAVTLVLEDRSSLDLTGAKEGHIIFVPGYLVKEDVIHYRASVNADNEIEPYTYIETESGLSMCVAMPVLKFHNFLHELEDKEAEL